MELERLEKIIIIIGCGGHTLRIHQPAIGLFLETNPNVKIFAVDKLQSRLDEFEKLSSYKVNTIQVGNNHNQAIDSIICECSAKKGDTVSIIISTPPNERLHYFNWALDNDFHVLADKPLIYNRNASTCEAESIKFNKAITELYEVRTANNNSIFECLSQRRNSPFYKVIRSCLSQCFEKTGAPLTNININYGDGQLRKYEEHRDIEYHGFNFGGGMLSHSAYHFIDLIAYLSDELIMKADTIQCYCSSLTADTFEVDFMKKKIESAKGRGSTNDRLAPINGELDVCLTFSFIRDSKKFFCATLQLLHTSRSFRHWDMSSKNLYKGNGRIRYENISTHQFGMQSITYSNFQRLTGNKPLKGEIPTIDDNAALYIERNPILEDLEYPNTELLAFERQGNFGAKYFGAGEQEKTRVQSVMDFLIRSLENKKQSSPLSMKKQLLSHRLLALACLARSREKSENPKIAKLTLPDILS